MIDLSAAPALLVDASTLVELVIDGEHAAAADRMLDHLKAQPEVELVSAAHGLIEAVGAVRRLNLAGIMADEPALDAVRWLRGLELRLDPTAPRLERAWQLRHAMTAYDATYAAASTGLDLPLISTDARLLTACEVAGIPATHLNAVSW